MSFAARWLPLAGVTLLAGAFAFLNRGETVSLRLGVATFHQAPLAIVAFLAFMFGMLSMLVLGLRQDLRLRRLLRERGLLDEPLPERTAAPAARPDPALTPYGEAAES
ncbi:MAG TPA: lipopolysaccharide assembly protein LapA domain-containing protein [Longimicrobiaceae bacterium]|nr:lipopolysaccharide assembly protein LapA domain-containing protein [Longimicrobiaceae bacterium]